MADDGAKNILLIMTDQLRYDCLGCNGHPLVKTPNIDRIAAMGVNFSRCYTPSAVCVPARASLSTGRYTQSHRVYWNEVPWPRDEKLMGDYMSDIGVQAYQCGKSHYCSDAYSGERPGQEQFMFDDRLYTGPFPDMKTVEFNDGWYLNRDYRDYLKSKGYSDSVCKFPHQYICEDGVVRQVWNYHNVPCVLKAEDTDTAFTSRRALEFLEQSHEQPWMLFLSYFRPHFPYCPSVPYFGMYPPDKVPAPLRDPRELERMHEALRRQSKQFIDLMKDDIFVRWMRSAYYGLIAELDDWIGRVLDTLEQTGALDSTLIILTSDHGDYLGDHYMYDKQCFYDQAYHIPLIVADPSAESDITRGSVSDAYVSLIDILPTMLDWRGAIISADIDGESLLPLIRGQKDSIRDAAYMLYEFGVHYADEPDIGCATAYGVRDEKFCYWYMPMFDDVLFDLAADPGELNDCAADPAYAGVIKTYRDKLLYHHTVYSDRRRLNWRYNKTYK